MQVDWDISALGTVWTFCPVTSAARQWGIDAFPDATIQHGAYVVEQPYALPICADLMNEHGFSIAINGREVESITARH